MGMDMCDVQGPEIHTQTVDFVRRKPKIALLQAVATHSVYRLTPTVRFQLNNASDGTRKASDFQHFILVEAF